MNTNEILISRTFETDWDKNNFTRWLASIAEAFKDSDIKEALANKASLCKMFYALKNSSVNRQKYQQVKKDILALQDFYGVKAEIPTREEVLESQEVTFLYKDLPSLLNFIDEVGNNTFDNYDKNEDLLNIKALVVLGWRGIKQDGIVQIKKEDIRHEANNHFIATSKGNFPITEVDYKILIAFSALSEYRGFPSGRRVVLASDDYLFHFGGLSGAKKNKPENSLTKVLEKFSDYVKHTRKAIVYRYLRKNALFSELHEELKNAEEQFNLLEQIQRKFACEYRAAIGYRTEYNLWLTKYHKSK